MIPLWRAIQRKNFTNWERLADFLRLESGKRKAILTKSGFPLNLPLRLAEKIEKNSLSDPLLKQFLPVRKELESAPQFIQDPLQEGRFRPAPRLLHKYRGRALLLTTSACAMHCRYCFRRHFDYLEIKSPFTEEFAYLKKNPSIKELLLSGGDPLSLSDRELATLLSQVEEIPHIRRLRFHTRFPIGIPERLDASLLSLLKKSSKQIWFVLHCNHARELDNDVASALKAVQRLGIPLLNQSVLLKGVNDSLETLEELFEALIDLGISPYYLHRLDPVEGAAHFSVEAERGMELIEALQTRLPGYALPRYVEERPGEPSKSPLF